MAMLTAGIALLTGVMLASYSPQLIDSYLIAWLPFSLFLSFINPHFHNTGLLIAGFLWVQAIIYWELDHRLQPEWNNKRLIVVGEVINLPKNKFTNTSFLIKPLSIAGYSAKLPKLIKLNWRNAPQSLASGQRWQWQLKLKQPRGYQNPGGFDYEKWLLFKGIHATGYVVSKFPARLLDSTSVNINVIRQSILKHIDQHCIECQQLGLIQALSVGYRGNISRSQQQKLQQTGTAHLIAISGLHIGIIAGVFYGIGLMLWNLITNKKYLTRKELALLSAWIAGLSYSFLAGFDLPAQRAMLMLSVVLFSLYLRLPFNLLNSIMLSMILVLLLTPLSILSASFWLTFCALLIIALGQFLLKPLSNGRYSWIKKIFIIQLLFSLLFIPISIGVFGQIHSASLLANLVAVPLVSFIIVPIVFLLLLLFWLPSEVLELLYKALDKMLSWLLEYFNFLQQSGFQALNSTAIDSWQLVLLFGILVLMILPAGIIRYRLFLLIIPVLLLTPEKKFESVEMKLTVLDVGMGTSIVVQTRHHSLIYDFGSGNKQGYSLGEWAVNPYLRHQGLGQPDRIILSHSDQDHVGGFYSVQNQFKNSMLYTGTVGQVKKLFPEVHPVLDCHTSSAWMWDGVQFEFLRGLKPSDRADNNRSCVLRITQSGNTVLITGDIEAVQERNLLMMGGSKLKSDILIAPHHGSLTSSTQNFVDAVSAQHVIFTAGFLNRWSFPRLAVVERYILNGAKIYRTDKQGAIQVECDNKSCKLIPFRQQHPRLWY